MRVGVRMRVRRTESRRRIRRMLVMTTKRRRKMQKSLVTRKLREARLSS